MKFTITVDRDEDGVWITECPSIPGCVSQGMTKEAAIFEHSGSHSVVFGGQSGTWNAFDY